MTLKRSASALRTLLLSFTRVFSPAIDASARNGRPIFAAAAVVCALLLLGGSVPAYAQSVSFAGAQTTVPASGLSNPFGVAVDGAGDVFIADSSNGRVVKVPAGGGPQTTVGSGLHAPYGVTVDGAGDVFIADTYNSRVLELPYLGSGVYGPQVAVGSGLYYPTAVAVDRAGDLFIVNGGVSQQVVEVPAGGGPQTTVPLNGSDYYFGVAVDGAGDVFVAGQNNNRVVEIPAGGGPQTTVGSGLSNPTGLAVDGVGDVFIADTFNNRVVEVPAGGGPQTTVPASGLNNPYGVAVDGAGDVFIADSRNNRVVEVQRVAVNFGNVNVCPAEQTTPAPCSQTLTLNYSVAATTTFGTINVVTQGTPNFDFRLSSGSTCTGTVSAGSTCTVNVTFAPRAPGVRMGAVQLTDNLGNLLVTTMVHGQAQGPAIAFGPGVQTMVGSGLSGPWGVAVDGAGDLFIADTQSSRVVEVPAGGGPQTTVGSGLNRPYSVTVDGAGDVFIADVGNNQVVEVPAGGGAQTTVGSGLNAPYGVAVDGAGDVFIADAGNNRVVEVPAGGGAQTTVGSGLYLPFDVAVDGAGDVFIADYGNGRVVEVPAACTSSACQTTVGSGLSQPFGVAVDGAGDIFIADNDTSQVVEVPAGGGPQTTVGSGLSYPSGVAVDGAGNVFIAGTSVNYVVEVHRDQPPTLSFASTPVGSTSSDSPQSVTIQNIGNQPLNAIDPGLVVGGPNFLQVAGSGTPADCTSTFSLSPGATCNLSISFEPQSVGKLTAAATFIDNALNATATAQGVALQATATQGSQTIAFGALSNQVFGTAPFTVSAIASSSLTVSFNSQTTGVCTVSGTTVTLVAVGTCTIQATQAGNTNYVAATPVNRSFQVTSSPGIYAPVNSSALTGASATFQWNGYSGATAYWLDVGSTEGGNNYYSSGSLSNSTFSLTVTALPSGGSTVWARWYYMMLSGTWQYIDYSYTGFGGSADRGVITSPAPSSTLSGSSVTFNWTAGAGASAYWVDVGSAAGGNNYYSSGNLGNVLTAAVNGLPTNGGTVYVTLYSLVSGQWLSNAYTYTAFNLTGAGGVMSTPTPGSTLTGSSVTFNWTAGAGASAYWVDVGSTAGGNNYSSSGNLGTALTTTVNGLPTDGSTIYVTLYSLIGGVWTAKAYIYTAFNATSGLAAMQTPTPGSTLSGNVATFTWSADASATAYWVDIGSTAGGNDVYSSGNLGLAQTTTVYSLPANGSTIYVTLYSLVGGQWLSTAATYVSGP